MSLGAVALAMVGVLVGVAIAVLGGWLHRPSWLRNRDILILIALAVLVPLYAGITMLARTQQQGQDGDGSSADSSPTPPAPGGGIAAVAPELLGERVLSSDDSSGTAVLFSSSIDGSNRQRLGEGFGRISMLPGGTETLAIAYDNGASGSKVVVRSLDGQVLRDLSHPPEDYTDDSPTLARKVGVVYFVRHKVEIIDSQNSTVSHGRLMRVPLDGSSAEAVVATSDMIDTVSVSDDGRVLAGACHVNDKANVGQGCLVDVATGRMQRIPGSEDSTVSDLAVSPEGRLVAYSSAHNNPYGSIQVFVYDIARAVTIDVSRQAGINDQPAWSASATKPCLLFRHDETENDPSIYLACLTPEPVVVPAIPVGSDPAWLGE